MKIETKALHAGQEADIETGAVIPPIYLSTTFKQNAPGEPVSDYEYTRAGNPNFDRLEAALASLESGAHATLFSSGLGALTALVSTLKQGDKIALMEGAYGGTRRLLHDVFPRFGITLIETNPSDLAACFRQKPAYFIFETPANPLLTVTDIAQTVALAKKEGVKVVVDNTFATPINQRPLELGADIVWHSTTKYLGGHSDVVGGVLITNDLELKKHFDYARKALGLNPSPFDAWLTLRGIKTLAIRMRAHNENGARFAAYLKSQPLVKQVFYPGYSGIVSVEFDMPIEKVKKMAASFQWFTLAESLGGVESLVCHPASMTHASIPAEIRAQRGLSDKLLRFSVGIEAIEDLLEDVKHQLRR